jgi:plasmid stability protein
MATLTIRNVPDDLYRSLKEQAARNRRSLNQEAIAKLQRGNATSRTHDEMLVIMSRARARVPDLWVTPEEIDAAIDEGRE